MCIGRFPAPLEVDRELYFTAEERAILSQRGFPAPSEVDGDLYRVVNDPTTAGLTDGFPTPREVVRELYLHKR